MILWSLFSILFPFFPLSTASFSTNEGLADPILTVTAGRIRGKFITTDRGNRGLQFLGVPFAEPPAGKLRFRPPIPRKPWNGILDCKQFTDACYQLEEDTINPLPPTTNFSEDCLSLIIITGENCSATKSCPVILYIHGGEFADGIPLQLPPAAILDSFGSKGVIFVSAGYRLAPFGFFTTETSDAPGNWAFHDMIAALKWVQKEISAFGGDPGQVTLMGHSTGASSVSLLTLSKLTEGLFNQAIMMSGTAVTNWSLNSNLEASRQLAVGLGCATEVQWESKQFKPILDCLRTKSGLEIHEVTKEINDKGAAGWVGPQIDGPGGIFTIPALELAKTRRRLNILTGMVSNEYTSVVYKMPELLGVKELDQNILSALCALEVAGRGLSSILDLTSQCTNIYSFKTGTIDTDIAAVINDGSMFAPELMEVKTMKDAGGSVYLYQFELEQTSGPLLDKGIPTPMHTSDLPYIFDAWTDLTGPFDGRDNRMRVLYPILFANFAKYGDPTPDVLKNTLPPEIVKWDAVKNANATNYYSMNLPKFTNQLDFHPLAEFLWNKYLPALDKNSFVKNQSMPVPNIISSSFPNSSGIQDFGINLLLGLCLALALAGILGTVIYTILQRKRIVKQLVLQARLANHLEGSEDQPLMLLKRRVNTDNYETLTNEDDRQMMEKVF